MHVELKFVSFVWTHFKQHNYITVSFEFKLKRKRPRYTYLLIPGLLPLRDQHGVRVAVLQQPVVQLLGDGLLLVVQLVHVPAALVGDLEDRPQRLVPRDVVRLRVLRVLHLVAEDQQVVLDV